MSWLVENWFWLTVFGLFMWMHMGMHGSHGDHGPSHVEHSGGEVEQGGSNDRGERSTETEMRTSALGKDH